MMNIGYDVYEIDYQVIFLLLKFAKQNKLKILHLRKKDDMYSFHIPTYQRYILKTFDQPCYYIKTIGFMKYILFLSKQYLNMLGVVCFLGTVITCSYFIFDIEIIGTMPAVNQQMITDLKKEQVNLFYPLKSYERLNTILADLKTLYKDKVEYISVYQVGSVFHVEYTKRKQDQIEKDDFRNLYAKKDGMIASFDVESGLIQVKKNDYVKKGDLLVSNTIVSTQNKTKIIPVKGHVYAYTFNQYTASIKNVKQDQAELFYQLLLAIRNQIPANAIIDKENVLQMTKTRSKITLKVHYTLLEDIAIKGEENEESH
ncbi:sporulation protein YqfD [Candidatus Stoquefichus massiliensis]|uniref:sporulation protein YqfD n=1 Tax=Candidatus Stoquefichus massiliensis TaxID=1470350 RepID=UPI0006776751|nr:sporulation protein YqfD [Candidatus Stoquefichus massiliensis]